MYVPTYILKLEHDFFHLFVLLGNASTVRPEQEWKECTDQWKTRIVYTEASPFGK